MNAPRQAGFTIVEISLFMGITALLFLVALLGTGNTIQSFRFTDSGRSLEAFAQKQYDDILNGLNNRGNNVSCNSGTVDTSTGQPVGSSNCLLMGKLLVFRQGSGDVSIYNVVGTEPSTPNYSLPDDQLVTAFNPVVVTQTAVSTYTLPWGAAFMGFKRVSDNQATNGLLLVRSPKSTRILSYTFKVAASVPNSLASVVSTPANLGKQTNFCIRSADNFGAPARLTIDGGGTQDAAKIVFDSTEGDCNGI